MSRKSVRLFGLTLAQSVLSKDHVYYSLEALCTELLVACETHLDGGIHYHCYMKTVDKHLIADLRELIEINMFDDHIAGSIHIDSLRNAKHWIKYCTKEDENPLYKEIDSSLFHQSWKINTFVKSNAVFNRLHPFLRQNPCLTNILEKAHANYWNANTAREWGASPIEYIPDMSVDWVQKMELFRDKHVYLYGTTGYGKSTYVNWLAKSQSSSVCFLPCGLSCFEFSLVADSPSLCVSPDAPAAYMITHRSTLLQLCDNGLVSINVKCQPIKQIVFRGRIIIVSNFAPECDEALLRRFVVIHANEYAVCQKTNVKIEIPSEVQETIYISSSEEDDRSSPLPSYESWLDLSL